MYFIYFAKLVVTENKPTWFQMVNRKRRIFLRKKSSTEERYCPGEYSLPLWTSDLDYPLNNHDQKHRDTRLILAKNLKDLPYVNTAYIYIKMCKDCFLVYEITSISFSPFLFWNPGSLKITKNRPKILLFSALHY